MENLIIAIKEAGAVEVYMEFMNLSPNKKEVIKTLLEQMDATKVNSFINMLNDKNHIKNYSEEIKILLLKHGLTLRLNRVMEHRENKLI